MASNVLQSLPQSTDCFEHLNISRAALEAAATDVEVLMAHVDVRDFDHADQVRPALSRCGTPRSQCCRRSCDRTRVTTPVFD